MGFADRIVVILTALIVLAGILFWRGHPLWACAALAPVAIAVILTLAAAFNDPVAQRVGKARKSVARLAELGLNPSPTAGEVTEAKALADALCGELLHDLENQASTDLVDALKNRGPLRSSVLRALSHMSSHLGSPGAIAAVQQSPEDFGPADFVSLLRLHRHAVAPEVRFALARRVVAETPPELRGEVFPRLLLIAPLPDQDGGEWIGLLRPHRAEILSPPPTALEEDASIAVGQWRGRLEA